MGSFGRLGLLLGLLLGSAAGAHGVTFDFTAPLGAGNRTDGGVALVTWADGPDVMGGSVAAFFASARPLSPIDFPDGGGDFYIGEAPIDDEADALAWNASAVAEGCYQPYAIISDAMGSQVQLGLGSITVHSGGNLPPSVWITNSSADTPGAAGIFLIRYQVDDDDPAALTLKRVSPLGVETIVAQDVPIPAGGASGEIPLDVTGLGRSAFMLHALVTSSDGRKCAAYWPNWLFLFGDYDAGADGGVEPADSGMDHSVDAGGDGGDSESEPRRGGCGCTAGGGIAALAALIAVLGRRPRR